MKNEIRSITTNHKDTKRTVKDYYELFFDNLDGTDQFLERDNL